MKKAIVLACARLATAAMPSLTLAEQPYRDNHGHHDVRFPPRHAYFYHHRHAAPHDMHESDR
ncbi:hypothetical protein [Paraburkholderia tagetis]|uniref:Uncharacterized protein n=1 Tax=Paraburkholderia tagetis TaxID=2913261 RepID=A0A9X1RSI4_9BURK|nr:hypothetical protein [Paraburkholderia tagetis]MCG5076560.1 hypothetical protein [Paraburkholderia tagetis]